MKQVLVFSGNPGVKTDFDMIFPHDHFEIYKTGKKYSGSRQVVAYSLGCRQFLRAMLDGDVVCDSAFFISPTIEAPSRISIVVFLLRKIITSLFSKKLTVNFIKQSCAPNELSPVAFSRIYDAYALKKVWQNAITLKWQEQNAVLVHKKLNLKKLSVVFGIDDVVVGWPQQKEILQNYLNSSTEFHEHGINGAGHALLWTHVNIVKNQLIKTGFVYE